MADIFIIVHANSTWNELGLWQGHCDTELSETGQEMARQLALRKDLKEVQEIYSSDLKRCYQTIEPLANRLNKKIIKDINLREGRWANHDERSNVAIPDAPYPYESRQDLATRTNNSLNAIAASSTKFPIVIVTHGTFMECFLEAITPNWRNEYKGIRTALNHFDYRDGLWSIVKLNDYSHLSELESNMICVTSKVENDKSRQGVD